MTSPASQSRLSAQGFINHHRKLVFVVMLISLVAYLYFVPNPLPLPNLALQCSEFAGMLLIFAGILGRILATISIGGHKDKKIMKTELYSVCRNPLYFASFLMAIGIGLVSGRLDFTMIVMTGYLAIFYPMMRNEAKHLGKNFPDFAEYEAKVPLFFPNFGLWEERKHINVNFRLVKRTLLDASLALLVVPVMILVRGFF
jgi:protein-S-isoprenylcysteine O-methyltransferase Ste14